MTYRHEAVTILVLSALLGMALLSAGCTRIPLGSETSVTVTADSPSDQAMASSVNPNNTPGIPKNPDGSKSGASTPPDGNVCDSSDNNSGTCPLPATPETRNPATEPQISDPAAAYCTDMNNSLEIRKNADGSESGVCILSDGTECDALEYYQGVCPPSPTPEAEAVEQAAEEIPLPDLAAAYCTDMGNLFEVRKNPDGSAAGVCILTDGTECDAIAYYEGTCPVAPVLGATPVDETVIVGYESLCRAKNFTYEIRMNPDGSEHGVCIFSNGRACDAQDYYVGDCIDEMALEES